MQVAYTVNAVLFGIVYAAPLESAAYIVTSPLAPRVMKTTYAPLTTIVRSFLTGRYPLFSVPTTTSPQFPFAAMLRSAFRENDTPMFASLPHFLKATDVTFAPLAVITVAMVLTVVIPLCPVPPRFIGHMPDEAPRAFLHAPASETETVLLPFLSTHNCKAFHTFEPFTFWAVSTSAPTCPFVFMRPICCDTNTPFLS